MFLWKHLSWVMSVAFEHNHTHMHTKKRSMQCTVVSRQNLHMGAKGWLKWHVSGVYSTISLQGKYSMMKITQKILTPIHYNSFYTLNFSTTWHYSLHWLWSLSLLQNAGPNPNLNTDQNLMCINRSFYNVQEDMGPIYTPSKMCLSQTETK